MRSFDGQYSGAALQAFIHGLPAQALVEEILRAQGLERIDATQWYPLDTARSIYYTVGQRVGRQALHAVGLKMIDSAPFPPAISDVKGVLMSLNEAYHMNVRGSDIGYIECVFDDDHTAVVTFATPFPCALCPGILQGCCKKYGATALIEHGAEECVDRGAPSCTYYVTW